MKIGLPIFALMLLLVNGFWSTGKELKAKDETVANLTIGSNISRYPTELLLKKSKLTKKQRFKAIFSFNKRKRRQIRQRYRDYNIEKKYW